MNFLFDENMPLALAKVLRGLGKPVAHSRDITELGIGAPDHLVIEYAANHNMFVVSRDIAMAEEDWFAPDVRRLGAGVIFIRASKRSGKEMKLFPLAQLVMKGWDGVELFVSRNQPPFVALMKANGQVSSY